jgi:uncharacterized protein
MSFFFMIEFSFYGVNFGTGYTLIYGYYAEWFQNLLRFVTMGACERGWGDRVHKVPEAYVYFLAHFHGTRDYFECHELLEEHWKAESDLRLKGLWHGLIQVAVSIYHERRGNMAGARKMMMMAIERVTAEEPGRAGLDKELLLERLEARLLNIQRRVVGEAIPYQDMELPIIDHELLRKAQDVCEEWGVEWNRASPLDELELIHRHTRRDRSDVIEERRKRLAERNKG